MSNRLFIGNLSVKVTENELIVLFGASGKVVSVLTPTDFQSGARKNYGFVEMESIEDAQTAAQTLNGHLMHGRAIRVTEIQDAVARNSAYRAEGGFQTYSGWRSRTNRDEEPSTSLKSD